MFFHLPSTKKFYFIKGVSVAIPNLCIEVTSYDSGGIGNLIYIQHIFKASNKECTKISLYWTILKESSSDRWISFMKSK